MIRQIAKAMLFSSLMLVVSPRAFAGTITPDVQTKLDAKKKVLVEWGKDAKLVEAVKKQATAPAIPQDEWQRLTVVDQKVRALQTSEVGLWLKTKKEPWVTEGFVSGADGNKLGFLSKPTSFSHKGRDKHEIPMKGEVWQGPLEVDESVGREQVQLAVPVVDGTTPIGSLVIGVDVDKL